MKGARRVSMFLWLVLAVAAPTFADMRIQYAEPVTIAAAPGNAQFDAYGRRFSLALENNERLIKGLPAARKARFGEAQLLRGRVDGQPGSWVRLTRMGQRLEGAIWDGTDLYAVTSHSRIARFLTTPLPAAAGDTVIYRLSDTVNALPAEYCGLGDGASGASTSGLAQYKSLVEELGVRTQAMALATRQVSIALLSDQSYYTFFGSDAEYYMLAIFNVAEGIYMEQLDLALIASEFRVVDETPNPFTRTAASALLDQLKVYRNNTPAVRDTALAHLITGAALDGTTVGIATLSSACATDGVSLSEGWGGTAEAALIMAHELGHNFGAEHDPPQCPGFLMAPQLNGSSTFSSCSRTAINDFLSRAACLTPANHGDLEVTIDPAAATAFVNEAFTVPVRLRSIGATGVSSVHLRFMAYRSNTVVSVTSDHGSCTANSQFVSCEFPSIAAGETRDVAVRMLVDTPGILKVTATARSPVDPVVGNNVAELDLNVNVGADAAVTLTPTTLSAYTGQAIQHTVSVASTSVRSVSNARVVVNSLLTYDSVTPSQGTCAPGGPLPFMNGWTCTLGDLAPGTTAQIVLNGVATNVGSYGVSAGVAADNDGLTTNNQAQGTVTVASSRDVYIGESQYRTVGAIGVPLPATYRIHAAGRLPSDNVTLRIRGVDPTFFTSISVAGGTCAPDNAGFGDVVCSLGTLAPGEARELSLIAESTTVRSHYLRLRVDATNEDQGNNNERADIFEFRNANEIALQFTDWREAPDGQNVPVSGSIISTGALSATNVVLNFTIPAPAHVLGATIDGGSCSITDSRTARCTRASIPRDTFVNFMVDVRSNEPGSFVGNATLTADADTMADNNAGILNLTVVPFTDVGIRKIGGAAYLLVGQSYDYDAELSVGRRAVSGVRLRVPGLGTAFAVDSLVAGNAVCTIGATEATCEVGDLEANATVPVRMRVRALLDQASGSFGMDANIARDFVPANNWISFAFSMRQPVDLALSTAAAGVTGETGAAIALPRITVSAPSYAEDVVVRVPLPAFASVASVSSSAGICSGTTLVECFLGFVPANTNVTIDVSVNAARAGNADFEVRVTAANGSNPTNDVRTMNLTATVPPPVAPPVTPPVSGGGGSAGGKKGGGSMEWMLLGLLGGLALRRAARSRPAFG